MLTTAGSNLIAGPLLPAKNVLPTHRADPIFVTPIQSLLITHIEPQIITNERPEIIEERNEPIHK